MAVVRQDILFTGTVQGVGFRYTTCRVAEQFDISGWVRNEPDGSVRCVVEGEQQEMVGFLAALRQDMAQYIADVRVQQATATGEFHGFVVRR